MDDYEAISILELVSTFTGEEELAAYRKLAKKYHPDYSTNLSEAEKKANEEKMKKVNLAHEYLKKKYFPNQIDMKKRINIASSSNYSDTYKNSRRYNYSKEDELEIENYKQEVIKTIEKIYNEIDFDRYPQYAHILLNINYLAIATIIKINKNCNDKSSINKQYKTFIKALNEELVEITKKYCEVNKLDFKIVNQKINYYCSVSEFFEQLEQLKKQYGNRAKQLQDRLNQETAKYRTYIGYYQLKDFISETIKKVIIDIGKDNYVIDTCIRNMHTIITTRFEEYFKEILTKYAEKYKNYTGYNEYVKIRISGKIDSYTSYAKERDFAETQLEDFIKRFHDEIENIFAKSFVIIDRLNRIKSTFNDNPDYLEPDIIYSLYELYIELKKCEQKFNKGDDITLNLDDIERNIEKILQFNKNRELLTKAYNVLITNYHNKLSSMNPIDYKGVQKVNEIFAEAIKIFAKIENQEIDIDTAIDILSRIAFNNYDEDMTLIKSTNKINIASGVYIKNPDYMRETFADESFFYLKEENGDFIMYSTGILATKEIMPIDKIKNEYMSLENFLQKAEYIGKEKDCDTLQKTLVLCSFKQVYISIFEGTATFPARFSIEKNIKSKLKITSDYSIYGGDYKDINELIAAIKKQVEDSVLSYENEEKRKAEKAKEKSQGFRVKF